MRYAYPCDVVPDEEETRLTGREAYNASFPDVHGAHTCGSTVEEITNRLQDCLEVALGGYLHDSEDLPEPSDAAPGQVLIAVSPAVAARLALYTAMRSQGVTAQSLAVRLGVRPARVRRLIDPYGRVKLPSLEAALAALGVSLVAEAVPSAQL
ncbi:type II toxin-antitoxin system HicB family antitoxin [Candidatus Poriferisodalis sp.]|uniref:type II toxin-antitoxin system HicB family antitoxin n=1 Tax=Candidatus Poriferisodalis sp. TaxID=3101277 RepID=UPI003C6FA2EA